MSFLPTNVKSCLRPTPVLCQTEKLKNYSTKISLFLFLIIKYEPQEKSLNLRFVWFVNSKSVPIVLK